MKKITAALSNGKVVDVEVWDNTNPPSPRLDGLSRVDCPEWVFVGCLSADGIAFTMPDGNPPPLATTERIAESNDIEDLLKRITDIRNLLPLARAGTGTNAERIKRLEDIIVPVGRFVVRAAKLISQQ